LRPVGDSINLRTSRKEQPDYNRGGRNVGRLTSGGGGGDPRDSFAGTKKNNMFQPSARGREEGRPLMERGFVPRQPRGGKFPRNTYPGHVSKEKEVTGHLNVAESQIGLPPYQVANAYQGPVKKRKRQRPWGWDPQRQRRLLRVKGLKMNE